MLYQLESKKTLDEIDRDLQDSAARNHFGIIAVHDLQQTMRKKGVDLAMECRIYEVCNPQQAKKVLEADGGLSTALPCRISLYGAPGNYCLATMLPTVLMKAFHRPEITSVAEDVEKVLVQIMKDAAGN